MTDLSPATIEHDVVNAVEHPSLTTIRAAAMDITTVLGAATFALGVVEDSIPASRGTVSTILAAIGAAVVVLHRAVAALGG